MCCGKNAVYLGLDIGSASVGWAVSDETYRLCRFKGKDMWGVRLFGEAQTAAKRRVARVQRRRYDRRNQRLALLQELFQAQIAQVDPALLDLFRRHRLSSRQRLCPSRSFLWAQLKLTAVSVPFSLFFVGTD